MNKYKKVACVVGTRPEAIKMAPVVFALRQYPEVECWLWSTGQHQELLNQALKTFDLKADENLNVMTPDQPLAALTAKLITGLDNLVTTYQPKVLLAQGDTSTVLATGLVGYYHKKIVGHVEAGLRTHNKWAPYPEEINRTMMSHLADWHFAPTPNAQVTLEQEGVCAENIAMTGNTVIDALWWVREKNQRVAPVIPATIQQAHTGKMILVTGHRRESFGPGFEHICQGLLQIVEHHPEARIVYAVHLNPNVQDPVQRILGQHPQILLTGPVSYEILVWLLTHCWFVMTDSGGIQEEVPGFGKPVLVMRDSTERPEGVHAGVCELVGTDTRRIFSAAHRLLTDEKNYQTIANAVNPYGDGNAAQRIAEFVVQRYPA